MMVLKSIQSWSSNLCPSCLERGWRCFAARSLAALELRVALFEECFHSFLMILGLAGKRLTPRLAIKQLAELMRQREVQVRLDVRVRYRRPIRDALRNLLDFIFERCGRDDPVGEPNAQRFVRIDDIGKEVQLARFCGA